MRSSELASERVEAEKLARNIQQAYEEQDNSYNFTDEEMKLIQAACENFKSYNCSDLEKAKWDFLFNKKFNELCMCEGLVGKILKNRDKLPPISMRGVEIKELNLAKIIYESLSQPSDIKRLGYQLFNYPIVKIAHYEGLGFLKNDYKQNTAPALVALNAQLSSEAPLQDQKYEYEMDDRMKGGVAKRFSSVRNALQTASNENKLRLLARDQNQSSLHLFLSSSHWFRDINPGSFNQQRDDYCTPPEIKSNMVSDIPLASIDTSNRPKFSGDKGCYKSIHLQTCKSVDEFIEHLLKEKYLHPNREENSSNHFNLMLMDICSLEALMLSDVTTYYFGNNKDEGFMAADIIFRLCEKIDSDPIKYSQEREIMHLRLQAVERDLLINKFVDNIPKIDVSDSFLELKAEPLKENVKKPSEIESIVQQVEDKVIVQILLTEKIRLEKEYKGNPGGDAGRIAALDQTILKLREVLSKIQNNEFDLQEPQAIKEALEKPIRDHIESFDKRKGILGGFKKMARVALNVITFILFPAALAKKQWHESHAPFYSLKGKTYESGEKALAEAKNISNRMKK